MECSIGCRGNHAPRFVWRQIRAAPKHDIIVEAVTRGNCSRHVGVVTSVVTVGASTMSDKAKLQCRIQLDEEFSESSFTEENNVTWMSNTINIYGESLGFVFSQISSVLVHRVHYFRPIELRIEVLSPMRKLTG